MQIVVETQSVLAKQFQLLKGHGQMNSEKTIEQTRKKLLVLEPMNKFNDRLKKLE